MLKNRASPVRISALASRLRDSEWFGHGLSVIFDGFSHGPRGGLPGVLVACVAFEGGIEVMRCLPSIGHCFDRRPERPTTLAAAPRHGNRVNVLYIVQCPVGHALSLPQAGTDCYVRGDAYLAVGQGSAAAAEFQKILDHSGIVWNCWTGALAHLGLARANALQSKTSQGADADAARVRALAAYKDFLTLWKDADYDIPILKQAKAESASL